MNKEQILDCLFINFMNNRQAAKRQTPFSSQTRYLQTWVSQICGILTPGNSDKDPVAGKFSARTRCMCEAS